MTDADDLQIGTFFTVNGFVLDPTRKVSSEALKFAERYLWIGEATTPRMAEDLAKTQCKDDGCEHGFDNLELFVTGVFEGKVPTVDKYARFLDPDYVGED